MSSFLKMKPSILKNIAINLKGTKVEKWPKLANRRGYHDNIKPHIALIVREKLLEIDWDILSHLLYFSDLFSDLYSIITFSSY